MTEIVWTYDPRWRAHDGEAPDGEPVCVARDGDGDKRWCAYHPWADPPHSWHRTKREAQAACEAAWRARVAATQGDGAEAWG